MYSSCHFEMFTDFELLVMKQPRANFNVCSLTLTTCICLLLQHPFCCHGYTRAVIQDLLDLFKRKSDKKGHGGEPDDDDDDTAPVDEVK